MVYAPMLENTSLTADKDARWAAYGKGVVWFLYIERLDAYHGLR